MKILEKNKNKMKLKWPIELGGSPHLIAVSLFIF